MNLSPDTLALNPDLAKQLKRSKTKTPGGKGRGHTDDAQAYAAAGQYVHPSAREMLRIATEQYIDQLKRFAPQCGIDDTRLAACLVALVSITGDSR